MAKKSKKKKGKAPSLRKAMAKMNKADALLKCALRSMKYLCEPRDADEDALPLYDEIMVLKSALATYAEAYEQIDLCELDSR